MNLHSLLDHFSWRLDPRLPMGRSSYFFNSLGIGLCLGIPYVFVVVTYYSSLGQKLPDNPDEYLWLFYIIYFVPSLLLQLRRARAAGLPLNVFWIAQSVIFVMALGGLGDHFVTTLFTLLLSFYLLFAPNKLKPVSQNPKTKPS